MYKVIHETPTTSTTWVFALVQDASDQVENIKARMTPEDTVQVFDEDSVLIYSY